MNKLLKSFEHLKSYLTKRSYQEQYLSALQFSKILNILGFNRIKSNLENIKIGDMYITSKGDNENLLHVLTEDISNNDTLSDIYNKMQPVRNFIFPKEMKKARVFISYDEVSTTTSTRFSNPTNEFDYTTNLPYRIAKSKISFGAGTFMNNRNKELNGNFIDLFLPATRNYLHITFYLIMDVNFIKIINGKVKPYTDTELSPFVKKIDVYIERDWDTNQYKIIGITNIKRNEFGEDKLNINLITLDHGIKVNIGFNKGSSIGDFTPINSEIAVVSAYETW